MCGIAGAIDAVAGRASARVGALNNWQRHRGPDHDVVVTIGAFTLGNARLAIQDPGPAGNQPFVSDDGRYTCVFNGEIYNYRQLIQLYQLPVQTDCDGEVIPALWAKLGIDSLAELRGMYAIALVDSLEERVYLARDPFGIKPLYWRNLPDGTTAFASEVRPLARLAAGLRLDSGAVARYLHLGAMAADQSPFAQMTAVPPNRVASFSQSGQQKLRRILPGGALEAMDGPTDLGSALATSIDLHLQADVPTALLLSAGVDSAAIAAVGHRLGRRLSCLTVATTGGGDESAEAQATALHYGHGFRRVQAELNANDVAGFFRAMQRPTIDGLNTYLVCKAVREAGFKVALSGLGGDEAVGGYSHFRILRYLPALDLVGGMPAPLASVAAAVLARLGSAGGDKTRRLLAERGPRTAWELSLLQREVLTASLAADLTGTRYRPAAGPLVPSAGSFRAMAQAETEIYMEAMLLPDADSFSMASSVELRVPFVDSQVFSSALAMARTRTGPGKAAIGAGLADPYLGEVAARPKRGFTIPMRRWLTESLAPVIDAVREPDAPVWTVADRTVAHRAGLLSPGVRTRWSETWTIAALNAWMETVSQELGPQ
jgi:asparagine synthase (glutamine-hydrolysing)